MSMRFFRTGQTNSHVKVCHLCGYVVREGGRIIKMRANTELKEGH